ADSSANFDSEAVPRQSDVRGGAFAMVGWLAAFVAGTALLGFFAALIIFFLVFLRLMAKATWVSTITLTAAAGVAILVLANSLNLVMPSGLLQVYLDLPWPFK